ncbi:MAG TPA: glycoside hydrolase family 3 C-terminal domain-containing protein [Candidatus Polarisedimenticolia bacterium]|nr:glycoside hydrolase family 3 C-terminal domain-containing protein [Candidatus Polarisedimenticolia bacterium]
MPIRLSNAGPFLAVFFALALSSAQNTGRDLVFRDPLQTPEDRAADLVGRLTLEEKVLQMQNAAPAIARLDIPPYDWWNEALHGVARAGRATVFPQAIGLAATWDTDLIHSVSDVISTEARAKYNEAQRNGNYRRYYGLTFWSPNVNVFRDPRWGRGQETYGEDPFLTSRMAVAFIQGMQGTDPHYLKTVATAKHFAVHSGPDPARHTFDARPSALDLEKTYLPAFRASVVEGQAASVMCSYNRVDGVPACASSLLLQQHLRGSWGFHGYVTSDCGAVTDIVEGHKYKSTVAEAAAAAVRAGTDLTCGDEYASLVEAVERGLISESEIDRALERLFVVRIRLGMFDSPDRVPYAKIPYSENDSPAHRQLALEAARESIVLLKNTVRKNAPLRGKTTKILPLSGNTRRIAVIGPAADDPDTMLANYHGIPSSIVTPLVGMQRQFSTKTEVRFALGSTVSAGSYALVPGHLLQSPGIASGSGGFLADYYPNPDFQGIPAVSRLEPRLYLQREMQDAELDARLPQNNYSVRWTGDLQAPYSGEYTICMVRVRCEECHAGDSAQVFLDGKLILSDETESFSTRTTKETRMQLKQGTHYRLRAEYRQHSGGVGFQFLWRPPAQPLIEEAVKAVNSSDVAVAFLGLNSELEGEEMRIDIPGFSGGDRTSLDLPEPQEKLLEAIIHTGKPVVVVLVAGSGVSANYAQRHAAAVLVAWYGGEEGGTAIAQTLAGENNPSGRLPVTFYRSVTQLPAFEDYAMRGRTYRYFTGDPLYPFGYGLSYSTFRYSGLRVIPDSKNKSLLHISAQVRNSSSREGREVVQLYVGGEHPSVDAPIRRLCGLQRIQLSAGESRSVEFDLNLFDLNLEDISLGPETTPDRGRLLITVGGGQPLGKTSYVETRF